MSDDRPDEGAEAEQGGVFGKLPASRPGTRSPRRNSTARSKASATKAKATASPKRKPATAPRQRPAAKPKPPAPDPAGADRSHGEQGGSLDDLAWAGVAAVAEAATLGVRLANRALGALRDSVDRR